MKARRNGPTWEAVFSLGISGSEVIVGIDEVGRGAWAGPVVAAAVVLPFGLQIEGLADSKLLSPARREVMAVEVKRVAIAIALGWVEASEVDEHGLSWSVRQSGLRALEQLGLLPDRVILDGRDNFLAATHPSVAIVKADALITPVAAASVVAKVARDHAVAEFDQMYGDYGFAKHKGYGTAEHRRALIERGLSLQHRKSYRPLRELSGVDD